VDRHDPAEPLLRRAHRDLVALGGVTLALSTALLRTELGGVAYAVLMSVALGAGAALVIAIAIARVRRL
jgi:hypothetical protein